MTDDKGKVVKLRQPTASSSSAGVAIGDVINPKSLLNMTDVEQEVFLNQLRDRRMRAAEQMRRAAHAKLQVTALAISIKLEKKADQVQRQYDKASKALDKLEELIYDLRALTLQYTDVDIAKAVDDVIK